MSFFRSLVRRRRFAMCKWRALCSSVLMLLSSEARRAWGDGQSQRPGARECRCICTWATHRVQVSPGVVAGRKHSKGAFAFQFLPHSYSLRVPLCDRGVHEPQCAKHMINGSHWRGSRGGRQAHSNNSVLWVVNQLMVNWPMYLQDILACLPGSCSLDSIHKGPHYQKEEGTEDG